MKAEELYRTPNGIAHHYSQFRVSERLLFTGHSHQAWPDCAMDGQVQAWHDAARYVDHKWEHAFARAARVKKGYAGLLEDDPQNITLGSNTHELVVKFLSALPLGDRPRLITTDGEFHTIRRQLDRLEEEGVEIVKVPTHPPDRIVERTLKLIDDRTAAVLMSKVFFNSGIIVHGLDELAQRCRRSGAEFLVDAYHALNVVPFSVKQEKLESAFIVGGGYKYCQMGEGNCFLRVPPDCSRRPVVTGWFAEFETLATAHESEKVPYPRNAERFAGSTYDPTCHYRASEVFAFFEKQRLTPDLLRTVSQHQIKCLMDDFDDLDLDPGVIQYDKTIPMQDRAGFLVLHTPNAHFIQKTLVEHGVLTDCRDTALRFGPAPYLSDRQLSEAMRILGEVINTMLR
ncbi:MAG: aminotransferase class V-fold PLP-dependent enzyme [Desulfobacteraceae bacterium]|nr:aminotransferase class V-fold PLP-dependent enzyme [Desulfobacteraceae bacterium]